MPGTTWRRNTLFRVGGVLLVALVLLGIRLVWALADDDGPATFGGATVPHPRR